MTNLNRVNVHQGVLDVAGVGVSYRDTGESHPMRNEFPHSCPVLLVHGLGGDSGTWDRFTAALTAQGRRVIAVDLRGHGRSAHTNDYSFDAFGNDVSAVVDHLGLQRVDLVGHSLGGYAVSVVAQDRPRIVRSLVIEEMPIPMQPGDKPPNLTGRMPSPTELLHAGTSIIRHPRAAFAFDRSMTTTALTQFRRPNEQWWSKLSMIEASTLVLRGGPGGMMDPRKLELLTSEISNCTVAKFKTGHSIHRDKYRDFETVVLPFLMRDHR